MWKNIIHTSYNTIQKFMKESYAYAKQIFLTRGP